MKKALSILAAIILSLVILTIALVFQIINIFIPASAATPTDNTEIITTILDPVTK